MSPEEKTAVPKKDTAVMWSGIRSNPLNTAVLMRWFRPIDQHGIGSAQFNHSRCNARELTMRKKRILVVDDEAGVTRLLKYTFEGAGKYKVRVFNFQSEVQLAEFIVPSSLE